MKRYCNANPFKSFLSSPLTTDIPSGDREWGYKRKKISVETKISGCLNKKKNRTKMG